MQNSIKHTPGAVWEFDAAVEECFDDMLARSIPQYEVMRAASFEVARPFVRRNTDVVDIGTSRGEALAPFVAAFGMHNHYLGLEMSAPMLAAARERFQGYINCGVVDIREWDLRQGYPHVKASVTLSILTLQFTPIEFRQRIVRDIYKSTVPGGVFIVVEKVLGATAELDTLMKDLYHRLKEHNGYGQESIERKRLSLEGVLVPVTAAWNEELLRMAGFSQIDCFWRWMNFAGWVAVREGEQ